MTDYAVYDDEGYEEEAAPVSRLAKFLQAESIVDLLESTELTKLGSDVVRDWRMDDGTRKKWKATVKKAFDRAAQEDPEEAKSFPWDGCANVDYPMLTVASQQFAARVMPAIVKGDKIVGTKVRGEAPQTPKPPPGDQNDPAVQAMMLQVIGAYQQRLAQWEAKEQRGERVATYLNDKLFYGMEGWEDETDTLLSQLSIAGTVFKKVYYSDEGTCSDYVNPLRLTVAMETKTFARCPRITHDYDLYPYEIEAKVRLGQFRDITIVQTDEDEQKPRVILEQHRLHDLDGDGLEEPWIVTVDCETEEVLRIDPAFGPEDVEMNGDEIIRIKRWVPFVKYPFLRDPKGRFYEIGFGQLLEPLTDVINATINQLLDAGTAENAGGGFIAAGLRIQGAGQGSTVRWKLGEYKVVNAPGGDLRNAIYERTLPKPSAVLFSLLELLLGAAKEISSVKDVITGEAPATAPVGTTLALIEQGLAVFNSIFKRIYRAEKEEFRLIAECERRWNPNAQEEYAEVLDDPEADFAADFDPKGLDIVPVSDPAVVTKMQAMARASFLQQFLGTPFVNSLEIMKRIFEAADIPNPDELLPKAPEPDPVVVADVEKTKSETALNEAKTIETMAQAGKAVGETEATNDFERGLGSVASEPGDAMGDGGVPEAFERPTAGLDGVLMAEQPAGPDDAEAALGGAENAG